MRAQKLSFISRGGEKVAVVCKGELCGRVVTLIELVCHTHSAVLVCGGHYWSVECFVGAGVVLCPVFLLRS